MMHSSLLCRNGEDLNLIAHNSVVFMDAMRVIQQKLIHLCNLKPDQHISKVFIHYCSPLSVGSVIYFFSPIMCAQGQRASLSIIH